MLEKYKSISLGSLPENTKCVNPDRGYKELSLDEPAIAVMTDHRLEKANMCLANKSIDRAMKQMAENNTNMLLVTNEDQVVIGLITSADISGEKPIQYVQETGKTRDQLCVRHLMTPIKSLPVMEISKILDSSIGDVLHTLNEIGSEFILVSSLQDGVPAIRGIFSARSIARSLKIFFDPSPGAKTFAEFTKALHGSVLTH